MTIWLVYRLKVETSNVVAMVAVLSQILFTFNLGLNVNKILNDLSRYAN